MRNMNSSRRTFLKAAGLTAAGAAFWRPMAFAADDDMLAARKKAAQRKRRMIMNNDGNDLYRYDADKPVTPEIFLSTRTAPLAGSHVDAIFYCSGVFNHYTHRSEVSELLDSDECAARNVHKLIPLGTDSVEVITNFCHANGMEAFWSMRMNDTHDSSPKSAFLMTDWKREHPEYLVGEQGTKYPYGCNRWSSVDFGVPEVREKVYRILEDVGTRYGVDGLEMDFFRHPVLFKPQMTGDPVSQEHCDMMTDLVRRVRAMADEVGRKRGRPLLLAMRGFDSIGFSKAIGIDLERWLGEGLIDIVSAGGYFKFEPWANLTALGEKYDVPVYAAFASRRIMDGGEPGEKTEIEVWRGEALNAWKAGIDGIYTFNRFDPKDQIFRELGDPELLATLDHVDQEAYVAQIWSRPDTWLKDGGRFVKKPEA